MLLVLAPRLVRLRIRVRLAISVDSLLQTCMYANAKLLLLVLTF